MWALHQILKQADKHSPSYSTHEEINEVHRASDCFQDVIKSERFCFHSSSGFYFPKQRDSINAITFDVFFPEKLRYNYSYQLKYPAIFFLSMVKSMRLSDTSALLHLVNVGF